MLLGWVAFSLVAGVAPSFLPRLLKEYGTSDPQIIIIITVSMAAVFVSGLAIGFFSDICRTQWGRRRPFILLSTPFAAVFLALIPFAPDLFKWLPEGSPITVVLISVVLVVGYQFFCIFISSAAFYYMIPDVVPHSHLGRFYALSKIVGWLVGFLFTACLSQYAAEYMKPAFVAAAALYGVSMFLICWQVREGEYPPRFQWWRDPRRSTKKIPYYLAIFFTLGCMVWAGAISALGSVFYRDDLGLSLATIGKAGVPAGIIGALIAYPIGVLVDRWKAESALLYGQTGVLLLALGAFFCLHGPVSFVIFTCLAALPAGLVFVAKAKWIVNVYPREFFGTFSTLGAFAASAGGILLGPLSGWLFDMTRYYRGIYLWSAFFTALSIAGLVAVRRLRKSMEDGAGATE